MSHKIKNSLLTRSPLTADRLATNTFDLIPWSLVSSQLANLSTLPCILPAIPITNLANATKTIPERAAEQQSVSFGGQAFERIYTDSRSLQRLVLGAIRIQDNQVIIIITTALPRSTNDELNKSFPSLAAGQRWFSNLPWVSQGLARANETSMSSKKKMFFSCQLLCHS